ncbi:LysR family transcriptional regulator [Vibrio coralliilyticus]|uniref:LysR family transcriptional regulator n=1 Tax=Vibrio coralliilyticus TaxID=190893 RepID=UPI00240A845A|nr:LysR family transcriptional regulator [Vibrio coralliilyticus]WFB51282.1 LysR family transcriptional regulator [Vibrio coralliilyticus]
MEILWLPYAPLYIALCEERSVAGAAKRLGCSNAHVSRQLRQLEQVVSMQLIHRTTRQFHLTHDGECFYRELKALMRHADVIQATLQTTHALSGTVRVAASASFGALVLTETFLRFREAYPSIHLEIVFTEQPFDIIEAGFDVAFYLTDQPPDGHVGYPLRALDCRPYAHRDYLTAHGTPTHPGALSSHQHILYRDPTLSLDRWTFHHRHQEASVEVTLPGGFSVNLVASMVDALMAAQGIAMLDEFAFARLSIAERQALVRLLPEWDTDAMLPLYILYPKRQHLPKRTRCFIDFCRQALTHHHGSATLF